MSRLLPIVEGFGDMEAVPLLVRRLLHEVHLRFDIDVLPAQRRGEWPKVKREFERFYLSARIEDAPILWVLDFDCSECIDHIHERGWALAEANRIDPTGQLELVFMIKEFESVFLWEGTALRHAFPELRSNLALPENPEQIRDAKGWVTSALPKGRAYKPTADQARIAARLPLEEVLALSPSLQRLSAAVAALV